MVRLGESSVNGGLVAQVPIETDIVGCVVEELRLAGLDRLISRDDGL